MAIDFTRYQPPGVYTEAVRGPQLAVRSSVPTAVAVFGAAVGYKTYRESIKINKDTLDGNAAINQALTQRGIITTAGAGESAGDWETDDLTGLDVRTGKDTIVVKDPNTGKEYKEGRDYVVHRISPGEDVSVGTRDDLYTILRVPDAGEGASQIDEGDVVQVQYSYTDEDYYKVYVFYDYDDVRDMYGEPFDAKGNIQSELTLACKFAFINGASTVLTCAVDPASTIDETGENVIALGDYEEALNKFRDEEQIAIIVPATGISGINELVKQHVQAQSNNRYERRAVIGLDGMANAVPTNVRVTKAQDLQEQRIALISPSRFTYYSPELNKPIILGGQFMAAAVAGLSTSMIAAMPLTHKTVAGFSEPAEAQREGEKSNESNNGLMVVEKTRQQQIRVRHGVTTNPQDLLTREWSIIGQQDVMVYRIRDYLDADGLIGMPIYDTTLIQVKASAESALVSLVRDEVIRNYQSLKVRQLATLPDVLEVRYEWLPAYPLNYIVVRYSVAVLTGDITVTETTL